MADLGILGLIVTTALLLAWLVAAARATGLHPRRTAVRRDWDADRLALVALSLSAIVFGLQSAIDWTWFVPGPTAMALVAAGFVAGRGTEAGPAPSIDWRRPLRTVTPARLAGAAAVLLTALVTAWAIWQPEASDRQTGDALALADRGETAAAIAKASDAADTDPLSSEPLLVLATIESGAGRNAAAEHTLEQAVLKFPGDPQTWLRLTGFQLDPLDRPVQAAQTVRGALYLDRFSQPARALFLLAKQREREDQAARR
jgi:hypothetical protein